MAEPAPAPGTASKESAGREAPDPGLVGRAFGAGKALVSVHLEMAQEEAARDAGRLGGAVALLGVAAVLVLGALALVDVALVDLCEDRFALPTGQAALVVAGGHLVIALPVALYALWRLKRPLLQKTRGRMKATLAAFRG